MFKLKKAQIIIVLISVCTCGFLTATEPNVTKTELKFEIDNTKSQSWWGAHRGTLGQGPIKPTYVAVFHIKRPHVDMPSGQPGILQILKTSAGQSLSDQQQKFMAASDAITWWGIDAIKNHDTVFLYAVSEEDAKKMVQAYFEIPANATKARRQEYEKYMEDNKQEIAEIEKVLPEKQKQADEIEPKFLEIMNSRYLPLSNEEAYDKAKDTILEMGKKLDILEIELAGIREKMSVINEYRKTPQDTQAIERRRKLPEGMLVKLEQMFVEQTIELKSAEAREQAAIKIRNREKDFVDLYYQWKNIRGEVHKLQANLENSKKAVKDLEKRLSNPEPYMLPPEIYQNKVTIYPVLTKQS
jgi:hypothetical protein